MCNVCKYVRMLNVMLHVRKYARCMYVKIDVRKYGSKDVWKYGSNVLSTMNYIWRQKVLKYGRNLKLKSA